MINQALAREFFAGDDPIGRRISFTRPSQPPNWRTVIGIVGDEKQDSLAERVHAEVYESHRQSPQQGLTIVVRAERGFDPAALAPSVRRDVRALDADVAVIDVQTLRDVVAKSMAGDRFAMMLLTAFACLALALAAIGVPDRHRAHGRLYSCATGHACRSDGGAAVRVKLRAPRENVSGYSLRHRRARCASLPVCFMP